MMEAFEILRTPRVKCVEQKALSSQHSAVSPELPLRPEGGYGKRDGRGLNADG